MNSRMTRIRVMIAHHTPVVCAGLEAALSEEGGFQLVPCVGADMLEPADLISVSVAVGDCRSGTELAEACGGSGCRVLILTDDDTEVSIRRAMRAGVRGYLLLTSPVNELVRALRGIHNGDTVVDPCVAAKIADSISGPELTLREIDVLRLLMVGLSDKAIAKRLMRSVQTVKAHMKSLRAKLNAASRTEATAIARRRGLVVERVWN
jgi:DNA-binding NarL/FixJ family response regulator